MIAEILKAILKAGKRSMRASLKKQGNTAEDRVACDPQSLHALAQFILHPEGTLALGVDDARRNIYAGLVEIVRYGQHSSNGLLVTNDGYFITAYHCVDNGASSYHVRLQDGATYPVERICIRERKIDLALAKAIIPEPATPREYRFYTGDYDVSTPVASLARRDSVCMRRYGLIREAWKSPFTKDTENGKIKKLYRHFYLDLLARSGDSGSIIIGASSDLMGIVSSSSEERCETSAARWCDALEIIRQYLDYVHERAGYGDIPWPKPETPKHL